MAAFPVSRKPLFGFRHHSFPLDKTLHFSLCSAQLRLEDPLCHQLHQGWVLALSDPDRLLLSLDVLDVPQQRLPLHVGGGAHHVSALSGLD